VQFASKCAYRSDRAVRRKLNSCTGVARHCGTAAQIPTVPLAHHLPHGRDAATERAHIRHMAHEFDELPPPDKRARDTAIAGGETGGTIAYRA
jgi:hypothetical protein